jgi:hypothetical protein
MSGGREGEIWGKVVGFGVVRMTGRAQARNPTWCEASACPIRALSVGADAGLPALFGPAGVSPNRAANLLWSLLEPPVERCSNGFRVHLELT